MINRVIDIGIVNSKVVCLAIRVRTYVVVYKRNVCHKVCRKSKSAECKHTLDVVKKEVYTAVLAAHESDADVMKNIWRKYNMEKLLNVENDWDGDVDYPEVTGSCCLISEKEIAAAIKGLQMEKAAGRTGVVSEMMKASGGFGSRWLTELINNKEQQRRLYS